MVLYSVCLDALIPYLDLKFDRSVMLHRDQAVEYVPEKNMLGLTYMQQGSVTYLSGTS